MKVNTPGSSADPAGPRAAAGPAAGPVRVLHAYSGNLYGGVERLLTTLAKLRGSCPEIEPHYAPCFAGRSSEELEAAGVPVHVLGPVRVRNPLTVVRARRALTALVRAREIDVVICHLAWSQAIFGPATRKAGASQVFWLHDPPSEPLHWTDRWARRTRPDLVLCGGRFAAERVGRFYPGVAMELVGYPVPAATLPPASERAATRAGFGASEGTTVILQVGRWDRHKGHLLHVEALGRLADRGDWACWMVGEVQRPHEVAYQGEVRALADRLGISDRVRFLGWQPDLGRLLAASDIYCQPNTGPEPFGLAFIEALYAGLPAVGTPLGGPADIITEGCGVLVPPGDPAALAGALAGLIADPARRARLGGEGPARARALCDPDVVQDRLRDVLVGLVRT